MNNVSKKFILIYGLYLGWLLSFTYEGPLFNILINSERHNINILLFVMHIAPILFIFLLLYRHVNRNTDTVFLYGVIAASFVFSLIYMFFGSAIGSPLHFSLLLFLSVLTGIAELLFIMSSTGWYIRYVPAKYIFVSMAFIILIANSIVMICNFLILVSMEQLSIALSVTACLVSLIIAVTIDKEPVVQKPHQHIPLPRHTIPLMCIAFYLFNIGGGIVFEVIDPLMTHYFGFFDIFSILPYIVSCVLIIILVKDRKPKIEYFLITATGILIIGLILFQFISHKNILIVTNALIESGYAIIDVFMWGLVGLLSYIYNKPYKIVFFTMSSNILGVFTGVMLSNTLKHVQSSDETLPALISLICALIGMLLIPIIYKKSVTKLYADMDYLDRERERQDNLSKLTQYDDLTPREKEIAKLLTLDMTNQKIAKDLFISENTLKKHAKNIYSKLQVKNKRELKLLFDHNDDRPEDS